MAGKRRLAEHYGGPADRNMQKAPFTTQSPSSGMHHRRRPNSQARCETKPRSETETTQMRHDGDGSVVPIRLPGCTPVTPSRPGAGRARGFLGTSGAAPCSGWPPRAHVPPGASPGSPVVSPGWAAAAAISRLARLTSGMRRSGGWRRQVGGSQGDQRTRCFTAAVFTARRISDDVRFS